MLFGNALVQKRQEVASDVVIPIEVTVELRAFSRRSCFKKRRTSPDVGFRACQTDILMAETGHAASPSFSRSGRFPKPKHLSAVHETLAATHRVSGVIPNCPAFVTFHAQITLDLRSLSGSSDTIRRTEMGQLETASRKFECPLLLLPVEFCGSASARSRRFRFPITTLA